MRQPLNAQAKHLVLPKKDFRGGDEVSCAPHRSVHRLKQKCEPGASLDQIRMAVTKRPSTLTNRNAIAPARC
jgi:hypothetical protein